jgi:protein TonB
MPPQGLRSRFSGSVPVSIAAHAVALLVLIVIPLVSDLGVPMPFDDIGPVVIKAAPAPPPPAERPPRTVTPRPLPAVPEGAPTMAPPRIAPETPTAAPFTPTSIVADGVPADLAGGFPGGVSTPVAAPPPARPQPPVGPVRAAQLPELPHKIVDAHPLYPDIARSNHIEGTVVLEAVIDTAGRVTQLRVLKSVPLLDQAALDAVRQWKYTPSIYYGRPVSVLMTITVRFTLQQ